ncbi:MAG: hypothetical protein ACRCZI_12310 [Cetobacterium sp.]
MAKKQAVALKDVRAVVMKDIRIMPVAIIDPVEDVNEYAGLPSEFKTAETLAGFPPSPEWQKPGDSLFGYYIATRVDIGPNKSRLYEISVPNGTGESKTVAVWGSSVIDRLVDSAFPPIRTGDKLGFIYLGEGKERPGQSPVKLFALKVLRPDRDVHTGR